MAKLVNAQCITIATYIPLLDLPICVPANTVCITVDPCLSVKAWSTHNVEFYSLAKQWWTGQGATDDEVSFYLGSIDVTQDDVRRWNEEQLSFDSFIFDIHGQLLS